MKQITLEEAIKGIVPADQEACGIAKKRWDSIAKPLYSLGWMEDAVARIAGAQHTSQICTEKKILVPLCADNGIVEEGVTQTGQDVTAIVAENFLDAKSCAAIICHQSGADIFPVDIGMAVDTPQGGEEKSSLRDKELCQGESHDERAGGSGFGDRHQPGGRTERKGIFSDCYR